jgi:hypothetical protein
MKDPVFEPTFFHSDNISELSKQVRQYETNKHTMRLVFVVKWIKETA